MASRLNPFWATAVSLLLLLGSSSFAQGPAPDAPTMPLEPVAITHAPQPTFETHKFLDKQNRFLFVAVAGFSAADFAVTRSNLQSGGQELNPMVRPFGRSTAGLAANFAGQTAGIITLSYFFHKTGHHKMERCVSYVNIASSAGAVTYGMTHR
jgi:hypothetical protein